MEYDATIQENQTITPEKYSPAWYKAQENKTYINWDFPEVMNKNTTISPSWCLGIF
jgi:hypothetical protein